MKAKIYSILKIIVSLSLLGLLFYLRKDSLGLTVEAIKRLMPSVYIFCCVIFILSVTLMAARFKILLDAQGISLSLSESIYLTFIGFFFNNFLPTAIGGDVVKAYYASKKTNEKLGSFISVFMDRFIGFLSLFILAAISLIFSYKYIKLKPLAWVVLAVLALLLTFLMLFFNKKLARIFLPFAQLLRPFNINEKLERAYNAVHAFKDKKGLLIKALLISAVTQISSFYIIYLFSKGMGGFIPIKIVLLLMPLVCIVSMLPSINGLGIREGSIYFLFGPYVGYENAFALSLLWLSMLFLAGVIGGISYLIRGGAEWQKS